MCFGLTGLLSMDGSTAGLTLAVAAAVFVLFGIGVCKVINPLSHTQVSSACPVLGARCWVPSAAGCSVLLGAGQFVQQLCEGDLRFAHARAATYSESIAFYGGEASEHRECNSKFTRVWENYSQLFKLKSIMYGLLQVSAWWLLYGGCCMVSV